MPINVEVRKHEQETNPSIIRRFTKRVQESGALTRARSLRTHGREQSRMVRRKQALKLLNKRAKIAQLVKLGKMPDKPPRRRGR